MDGTEEAKHSAVCSAHSVLVHSFFISQFIVFVIFIRIEVIIGYIILLRSFFITHSAIISIISTANSITVIMPTIFLSEIIVCSIIVNPSDSIVVTIDADNGVLIDLLTFFYKFIEDLGFSVACFVVNILDYFGGEELGDQLRI